MNLKSVLTAATFFLLVTATAQENNLAEAINIGAGGTFGKAKILKKADKLVLAQVTVSFKQMTTKAVQMTEKKRTLFGKTPGKSATASVTAYLETTDGELADADYLEVTNHFHNYFQVKLKEAGIDTVAWAGISNTEFFKDNLKEKDDDNEEEKSKGNAWVTYNAYNGATLFKKPTQLAFLRLKKAAKLCDEFGGPALFVNTTVDFADLDVAVDVKTSGYKSTWTPNSSQTTTMKSETKVRAFMKIPALTDRLDYSYLINEKQAAENISLGNELPAELDYATALTEDPERATKRSKFFSVSLSKKMESDPVVISTTKEKYKTAAKKALEKYADAFVARLLQMKKD
jgi:hypothetical protein